MPTAHLHAGRLLAKIPFNWRDLTPFPSSRSMSSCCGSNAQLPYKTVKRVRRRRQERDAPLKMATARRREDHVLTGFPGAEDGSEVCISAYKSGGAATQLVGNHTARTSTNSVGKSRSLRAGQVRPLCVFDKSGSNTSAKSRPTCLGMTFRLARSKAWTSISDAGAPCSCWQVTRSRRVLRRSVQEAAQTAEYKDYMEKQALKPNLPHRQGHGEILEEDDALNKNLMTRRITSPHYSAHRCVCMNARQTRCASLPIWGEGWGRRSRSLTIPSCCNSE